MREEGLEVVEGLCFPVEAKKRSVKYQALISSLQLLLIDIDVSRFYKLNEFRILFRKIRLAWCLQQVGYRPDEEAVDEGFERAEVMTIN